MRYLYHQGDRNVGPVSFEQLQELAQAGTIDNMTPVLAEGAKAWSRWLFIKDAPPSAPAPAATPKEKPAEAEAPPRPRTEKKAEVPVPDEKPQPKEAAQPAEKEVSTPTVQAETAPVAAADTPAEVTPKVEEPASAPVHSAASPCTVCSLTERVKPLLPWLPAALSGVVFLICLLLCFAWQKAIGDTRTQTAERMAYAAMQAQHRPDLGALEREQQELDAQNAQKGSELEAQKAMLEKSNKDNARFGTPSKEELSAKQKDVDSLNTQIKAVNKQIEELKK